MSPSPSPLNPSHAVERIREIIVGRQLDRLDQRVSRLEAGTGVASDAPPSAQLEDRLLASEAKLEALKDHVRRLGDTTREQTESYWNQHREETQRLAAQIHQVAALKDAADPKETAKAWLKANPDAVKPWLEGVTTFDGGDAAAAVEAALKG